MSSTNGISLPGSHNVTRAVLDNGIVVLVYENYAAQSVVISGGLKVGSMDEAPAQNGLAAMTTSALMRGTQHRDFNAIASALEDIGADVDLSAGTHRTSFSGKGLAEDLPTLIELLADVLRYPTFPAAHVERLRGEVITMLQIRMQDTRYRARRAFYENLYPDNHPYHYGTSGTLATVPNLTVEHMAQFHSQHFTPEGMIIAIVGAVRADEAVDIVRARLEDWRSPTRHEQPALPAVPPVETTRRVFVSLQGKVQSDLIMGVLGPSRKSDDYYAATLANSVLGQFGMMGRIGASVREDLGLAYYAYSQLDGGMGASPWSVIAGVNPANVDLTIERSQDELRRLISEPISDQELADNQSYFTGRLPLQLESNEGIAGSLVSMEMYELGLDYLITYRDRIYSLTKDDLLAAARHYLNPDALIIAVAGPNQ